MHHFEEKYINPFTDFGFKKLFGEEPNLSNLSAEAEYEDSLKYYRDLKNSLDTAFNEGVEQGITQVVIRALKQGSSDELILSLTGISAAQLAKIKQQLAAEGE